MKDNFEEKLKQVIYVVTLHFNALRRAAWMDFVYAARHRVG